MLDPAAGLTQVLADGTNTYLYGNARLGQYQGSMQYFGSDALGSVRQLYDASGQVVGSTRYDPYGNVMAQSGATSVFAFAGEQGDATGLTYLRARYYSAYLNQWIQPDTILPDFKNPQSLNRYTYVLDNPVLYTDPSGHDNSFRYDREAAAGYAKEWNTQINPAYGAFGLACISLGSPLCDDCTSFVSQALKAGGLQEDETWFFAAAGYLPSKCDPSSFPWRASNCGKAWAVTDGLHDYLTRDRGFSVTTILGESFEAKVLPKSPEPIPAAMVATVEKGDVVFYDQHVGGTNFNHSAMIVDWGPPTEIAKNIVHNEFRFNTPLIADHGNTYSDRGLRSINDNVSDVFRIDVVHIPDVITPRGLKWDLWQALKGCGPTKSS